MYDLIIQNGKIIDGSGNPWFRADLAVQDGKIVKIARKIEGEAKRIIDAKGLTVAPGFCDLHTHSDESILYNHYAKSSIHAGVTTERLRGEKIERTACCRIRLTPKVASRVSRGRP